MRSFFLFFGFVYLNLSALSQGKPGVDRVNWDDQFVIVDKNGGLFHSYYDGIDGNPFFIENFLSSTIKLVSGLEFKNVTARLDLYKQIIHIKLNGDTVKMVLPGNITEIIFYDTVQSLPHQYKFQTGYPEIDNLNRNDFYQVLSDGKVTLLKSSIKKINKTKNEMSGEVSSQFDIYEDHYLYVKYEMKRVKKDKEYILTLLADKRKELETYITVQKLNIKSIVSIKQLIDYYNSL
ncbi:MAG TPA: hypothetical protein VHQ93_19965 [Chitinophagaceae bacterium]|jgi:hypothetical protein|nr:hypothetical protein [Chitinophagaceae bacterium]